MPTYPILPSLSRAPAFKVKRSIGDDGTIADPAESGYVSTRPRFTRIRRNFSVTFENLIAEDVRALDKFETQTILGKSGGFWLPNLLPNGSFEIPADSGSGQLVSGWTVASGNAYICQTCSVPDDGVQAVRFRMAAGVVVPVSTTLATVLAASPAIPVDTGDGLQVQLRVSAANAVASPRTAALQAVTTVTYADSTTATVTTLLASAGTSGYASVSASITIPAAGSGAPAVSAALAIEAAISTDASGTYTTVADAAVYVIDSIGLALTAAVQPFGRMPGVRGTGRAVRLSKNVDITDMPWAEGAKRYMAVLEVVEI